MCCVCCCCRRQLRRAAGADSEPDGCLCVMCHLTGASSAGRASSATNARSSPGACTAPARPPGSATAIGTGEACCATKVLISRLRPSTLVLVPLLVLTCSLGFSLELNYLLQTLFTLPPPPNLCIARTNLRHGLSFIKAAP